MPHRKNKIIDAHTHFFSYEWFLHFSNLASQRSNEIVTPQSVAEKLCWDLPSTVPEDLGRRWVEELDRFGIRKQVLFASKLNDAELLAVAVQAFPSRLLGYVMIDPTQPNAREQTYYAINLLDMRGILLFPAMHHFHADDQRIFPIYEEAAAAEVPVFIHFGKLSIPIFNKLGLPDNIELAYSNPLDLKTPAREFPEVNFIVPHFGGGCYDEALSVARAFVNVYFDTASSNSWITPPLTLRDVFKQALADLGAARILFGTDSSHFPRGWRKDIFDVQLDILESLEVSGRDQELIFGGNISRLLGLEL